MILLCDRNQAVVDAWLDEGLDELPNVAVVRDDILDYTQHAIVLPGNSFGIMDGGLDLGAAKKWPGLEAKVRDEIGSFRGGELAVGDAVGVSHCNIWFVYAPTMRTPRKLGLNDLAAYFAVRAALTYYIASEVDDIVFPGMGTGVGHLCPKACARQMRGALMPHKQFADIVDAMNHTEWLLCERREP